MGHSSERLGWKPRTNLTSHNASIQNERHKDINWDGHSNENLGTRTRVRIWVSMVLQSQSFSADPAVRPQVKDGMSDIVT